MMTAAAVYGDIGLIGRPNDKLTAPVVPISGITDTQSSVYGDIGLIGRPNDKLLTPVPVKGITDIQSVKDPALYSRQVSSIATRTLGITVLPGQSLFVTVSPSGSLGGLNADVAATVNGDKYNIDEQATVELSPGLYDLDVGISAVIRGGCVVIPAIDYVIEAYPAYDLNDDSGNDNHAAIASLRRKEGVTQRAIAFEGEPDHVEIPDLGLSGTQSRGISMWIKDAGDGPLCKLSPDASIEIDSGTVKLRYFGSDTTLHSGSVREDYWDSDWHHLMIWIDSSGTISTWIDSDTAEDVSLSIDHGSTWDMEIGRSGNRYWTGTIDEIVLLNARPTAVELTVMKNAQNPLEGSVYAERLHGNTVYPLVTDGEYPPNPVRGQTVVSWDGSTAQLEIYIDGSWRAL